MRPDVSAEGWPGTSWVMGVKVCGPRSAVGVLVEIEDVTGRGS